jgi:ribosomal protein L37E
VGALTKYAMPTRNSKVQCCGSADYHIDKEICCTEGMPAPFLQTREDLWNHTQHWYVRPPGSMRTKLRTGVTLNAANVQIYDSPTIYSERWEATAS